VKAIAATLITALALIAAPGAAHSRPLQGLSGTSHWFDVGPGKTTRTLTTRRPSGVVVLTRLTVTRGIIASVRATIPGVAGVAISTDNCRSRGRFDVCTQSQEWCPMPRARWRIHLVKTGGPAGVVRFDFVVRKEPG
jgi:hypothetical protein